jgi:hypothetical protein
MARYAQRRCVKDASGGIGPSARGSGKLRACRQNGCNRSTGRLFGDVRDRFARPDLPWSPVVVHVRLVRRRLALGLATVAVTWSVALLALAFVPGFWTGIECEAVPAGRPTDCGPVDESLVSLEGFRILVLFGAAAFLAGIGWLLLHESSLHGGRAWRLFAWTVVGVLCLYAFAALFSIGLLVAPTALLLAAAVAFMPTVARR